MNQPAQSQPEQPHEPKFNKKEYARNLLENCQKSDRYFIEHCLSVPSKKEPGKQVPFIYNRVQRRYHDIQSDFDFVLKSRKLGFSTLFIAKSIWACNFKQGQHAIFLCQDDDSSWKQLEERVKPLIRSSLVGLNAEERANYIYFPQTGSRLYVGTAGAKKFGRGSDVTRYHFAEYAHWKDTSVITGIEEALIEGAQGYIETTANGQNFACEDWKRAKTGLGRYKAIFVPWFSDPDCKIEGGTIDTPTEEENRLREAYNLTNGQLAWRRNKISKMSRPELFVQEYPSNDQEAFMSSGRMVFDWVSLIQHEKNCSEPKWTGVLRDMGEDIEFQPLPSGNLKVWEMPQRGHVYVIGADIAEGLPDGCFSTAFVMDVGTSTQVAEYCGHIPPDKFGDLLTLLGLFYNVALLAPEAWPGVGAVTTRRVIDNGYTNIYRRAQRSGHRTGDQLYGWETTARTRPDMLLSLAGEAVRDLNVTIKSKHLIEEMRAMVYDDDGTITNQIGTFVDRVFAAGIAWSVSRDVASRTHYTTPKLREMLRKSPMSGPVTPHWTGNRYGIRGSDA